MRALKHLKKTGLVTGFAILLSLAACASPSTPQERDQTSPQAQPPSATASTGTPAVENGAGDGKTLIAYFSKTGNTEDVANQIQELTGGDVFQIEPTNPYPDDYQETTEIARDELDENARPEVSGSVDNMDEYDTIILGYPIWWGQAPMSVLTFLESYDLEGKTIAPFATAATSGIEGSIDMLKDSAAGADFLDGRRVTSDDEIEPWLQEIGIAAS